ncbi:unnamed protein product [Mycena citricolor]|uniref:DUF676 domain-containing protein n=1 Tax=Mycena citricolor TaxID=2018698 RepID=A0AAD2GYS4_9AGAR|nr:unnamed protein product [Mycena citricolor]
MTSLDVALPMRELLLLVFIHGFKGTDQTFRDFPERLQHVLTETVGNLDVQCVVFPAYETKGDLNEAVVKFADWLTNLTVEKEVASGGGAGSAKIVLCGHSMGGLLAADTLKEFLNSRPDNKAPLWPKIIACIAFDTPYLGLNPDVFKSSATKALQFADTARNVGTSLFGAFAGLGASKAVGSAPAAPNTATSSPWAKWAAPAAYAVGGALLAGAAAGTTYYHREDIGLGYSWATDHMKYVGNLWDSDALDKRVDFLTNLQAQEISTPSFSYTDAEHHGTHIHRSARKSASRSGFFILARNGLAADEIQAHTGMFSAQTNDGYYDLGLQTANLIKDALTKNTTPAPHIFDVFVVG